MSASEKDVCGRKRHDDQSCGARVANGASVVGPGAATSLAILADWSKHHSAEAPAFAREGFGVAAFTRFASEGWWARQDSNLQPDRYERPALTIELQAPPRAAA